MRPRRGAKVPNNAAEVCQWGVIPYMKAKPIKAPTIVVKKIPLDENGKKVWGYCYPTEDFIELERDQPDKEFLDTLIHECLHHFFHSLGEKRVSKTATIMANEIWRKGYRSKRRKR